MRKVLAGLLLGVCVGVPTAASADPAAPRRPRRDRFANTISFGGSAGLGSPLGLAGLFLEYRPWSWVAVQAGGGAGGSFGPAIAGTLYVDPIRTRGWALGVGGSASHNFSIFTGTPVPGRPALPAGTNWLSVEVQTQVRPSRHLFLRLGVGRAFLLDTQAFRLGTEAELNSVNLPSFPLPTPIDAVRAAARDEAFGVWFVHLDLAPVWRL
jgi:hypothetical protein